ncbi:MAG TPA: ACT domain-containing protein [Mycobacteriales bacterium]|jgi:predicted amino acid-binding ACT domain protein|nr:ACT domain-containing protein [Mycobacteriales bacterium]
MAGIFARLRIDVPDHPGALAAVSRVLAGLAMNVVEVSIHEVEGERATDEIVVHCEAMPAYDMLHEAVSGTGAELLSVGPCSQRSDPTVVGLTWVTAMLDAPERRSTLATGIRSLAGIDPVQVVPAAEVEGLSIVAAAIATGRVVVQHVARVPELLRDAYVAPDESGAWLLAASDGIPGGFVVLGARPYAIRFTATELSRLSALLDCRRQLIRSREESAVAT